MPSFEVADTAENKSILTPSPGRGVLHEIFESQADRRPDAPAVVYGGERISYSGLDRQANRLARHLRRYGVERGAVVALLLPRSIDAYASLLGILKAGAAYVPIDPEYPPERAAYILKDSGARALVTSAGLAGTHRDFEGTIVRVDADRGLIAAESHDRLAAEEAGAGPRDLCYIIYTSGTTGRPKGVMVEHRNAHYLVCAEREIYTVRPEDRVYQGASLSFDLSVEEVWLAFAAGATLVAATPEMAHAGPDLSRLLTEAGVTVLSCVPTLLSLLAEDVPTVRLLIFGGEVCPPWLVERWARPGRRMVNTYGPTESTVIATYAELSPGKPVTIGRPVPGYRVYLVNEKLEPVPRGQAGEICVGGPGVVRGYLGLPELTREGFVRDPFARASTSGWSQPRGSSPGRQGAEDEEPRLYRTGDLARLNAQGDLEFLGRADAQVKLRGFRVELSEIETVLMQMGGVRAAACTVREDQPGLQQLVGYVVPGDGSLPDEETLRARLRDRLPPYMVPALIETVDQLPRLPSGKLDRASLPPPRPRDRAARTRSTPEASPRTETERVIARIWQDLFRSQSVSRDDDFFLDLGGHSLLAARMVSELRKKPRFATASVTDVYEHPTIASLAEALDSPGRQMKRPRKMAPARAPRPSAGPSERRRHFIAGILQSAGLYFSLGFRAFEWVTPYLLYFLLLADGYPPVKAVLWSAAGAVAVFPALLLIALTAKWLVLGYVRPGRYPLWGAYYLRWWFAQTLVAAVPLQYLDGTPLLCFVYRLLGARIGKDVHLSTRRLAAFDLTTIGEGSSIDNEASLLGYTVEDGELRIGRVTVGRGCYVGARAVLSEGSVMENGARLLDLSLLPRGERIPRGETWAGSPARSVSSAVPATPPAPAPGPLRRAGLAAAYTALVLAFPILLFAAVVPGLALLTHLDLFVHPWLYLAAAPVVGASFVLLVTLEVAALKWMLLGRVRPGTYRVNGGFYIRNWIVEQLRALSLDFIGPLHATLYLAPWYRALGAKLGRFVELSTAISTPPDLLEISDGGTVADEASLGMPHIERGWMKVGMTRIGRRAFIGNSGVLPTGITLGHGSLVGVLSIAPADPRQAAQPDSSWLGSPPIRLPRRQPSQGFSEEKTYRPPRKLWLARGAFELLRVTLPAAGFVLMAATVIEVALRLAAHLGLGPTLLLLPLVYTACCAAVLLVMASAKWALIGRFRPFSRPLWSNFIWRLELQNALYEFLATTLVLEALKGTPFLPWFLRLLGARIGRRVFLHTTGFLEFDLVNIGDRAALNDDCILQTHLFEDRILKASYLHVGAGCTVGARSVVLYDSKMEDGARLDALSLLMKGERLPAGTDWTGNPAQPSAEPSTTGRTERAA